MLNILVVAQNLFFLPRIVNVANPYQYSVKRAESVSRFWSEYSSESTALVLVDLAGDKNIWTKVITDLVNAGQPRPRIVGFGPHSDVEILEFASNLGCDKVLTRGEFSASLSKIVESKGAVARN